MYKPVTGQMSSSSLERVDVLSDTELAEDDSDAPAQADPTTKGRCGCDRDCIPRFQEQPLYDRWRHTWTTLKGLHKVDQDAWLFDRLRSLALVQGNLSVDGAVQPSDRKLQYEVCGHHVCRKAFCLLYGIGNGRFMRIKSAVYQGESTPPLDLRYCQGLHRGSLCHVGVHAWVFPNQYLPPKGSILHMLNM